MKRFPMKLTVTIAVLAAAILWGADNSVTSAIQAPKDRAPAVAFRLEDAKGKMVSLSDFRGKVVVVNFWATECSGCVREIPVFMDVARSYGPQGVAVVGISADILYEDLKDATEAWARVRPFVVGRQIHYSILMGNGETTDRYGIQSLPLTYLVDRRGRVAAVYSGVVNQANLEGNIQALLRERE